MSKLTKQAKKIFDADLDKAEIEILRRWKKLHSNLKNSKKSVLKSLFSLLKK